MDRPGPSIRQGAHLCFVAQQELASWLEGCYPLGDWKDGVRWVMIEALPYDIRVVTRPYDKAPRSLSFPSNRRRGASTPDSTIAASRTLIPRG
jgi:hypothetical protein